MRDTETTVIADIRSRQERGINKYGTTVAKNPLELYEWVNHLYEELLDASVYCKRILQALEQERKNELAQTTTGEGARG